jgi:hypothetical protein
MGHAISGTTLQLSEFKGVRSIGGTTTMPMKKKATKKKAAKKK